MHASVIIPTKNPGSIFREVLRAVQRQQVPFEYEIIVIDSGSTDGTVEVAASSKFVRLIQVDPTSFGHGRTRNAAAESARGAFLAFLTHDAIPANDEWLANLVGAVEAAPEIAGAFGRHIAHKNASIFTKRDLEVHFDGFLAHPLIVSRETNPARYEHDQGWRQFLHFYSDNNSCMRRTVWEQIPYPDVEFAEDQMWAKLIIDAGYAKAYAPAAVVEHSHDYKTVSQVRRAFDEASAFRRMFGYRLSSGLVPAVRSFAGLSLRDVQFARANDVELQLLARRVARNGALVAGHLLGTYSHRLPQTVATWLSHDKRLYSNLRTATET